MYIGIAGQEKGTCVNDCDAYQYALEQMQWDEELQKELLSGFTQETMYTRRKKI